MLLVRLWIEDMVCRRRSNHGTRIDAPKIAARGTLHFVMNTGETPVPRVLGFLGGGLIGLLVWTEAFVVAGSKGWVFED